MATGRVVVESSPVAGRILATVLGLPTSGPSPVTLLVTEKAGGDRWQRTFGRRGFATRMRLVGGQAEEMVGPVGLIFDLEEDSDGAQLRLRAVTLGPLRVAVAAMIMLEVRTRRRRHGGFTIDTELRRQRLRGGTGPVLRYRGSLR